MSTRARARAAATDNRWPLGISANKRHLVTGAGVPFFGNGDTPWMLVGNCTNAQIDTYLNDRATKGFNAVLVEMPTACYATQTPLYNNVDGVAPFTSTSYTAATFESLNETYWQRVDYAVIKAKALGIVCFMTPAYLGFGGGSGNSGDQGWDFQVNAATSGHLQSYGATLANRYKPHGNVVFVMGGDRDAPNIAQSWNIVTGIRSVWPTALITYHGARGSSAYSQAGAQTGFNLNCTYTDGTEYTYCATEYARSGPIPFGHLEGWYEADGNTDAAGIRRQAYATILSGGCFHFLGVSELWGLGAYGAATTAAEALANQLNTTGANDMTRFRALFTAYSWWLLAPKTDTSVVTTSLGTGTSRVIPARASDGSFAMVYTPSVNFTVDMTCITHASVRARWYDPAAGTYSTDAASPLANTGTHAFTAPGERVLVLD